jgi:hypothetical protein
MIFEIEAEGGGVMIFEIEAEVFESAQDEAEYHEKAYRDAHCTCTAGFTRSKVLLKLCQGHKRPLDEKPDTALMKLVVAMGRQARLFEGEDT